MAAALGLLLSAGPASAQTYEFDTTERIPSAPPGMALGSWHVTLEQQANSFRVLQIRANTGVDRPNANVQTITLAFFDEAGTRLQPVNRVGGGTNVGRNNWDPTIQEGPRSADISWNDPTGGFETKLRFEGQTTFGTAGFVNVAGGTVRYVRASLFNGGKSWTGTVCVDGHSLIPEPGSLALVIPGLMPLGLVLLRRRGLGRAVAENDGEDTPA